MRPIIESARAILDDENVGSIASAVEAGNACLDASSLDRSAVDLVVNVGVYRDDNIVEPSVASLLQQRLELNLDPMNGEETFSLSGTNTFSFDLMNGPCGFLQAAQVAGSLMATGQNDAVLVLASDSYPTDDAPQDFPYTPSAAAAILTPSESGDAGFQAFATTAAEDADSSVTGSHTFGESEHPISVEVDVSDGFVDDLRTEMIDRTRAFLDAKSVDPASIDGFVVSQPAADFAEGVAEAVGITADAVVDTYDAYGDTLSSSLLFGYADGSFEPGDRVLFAGGGSDLTVSCGLYRAD